MLFETQRLKVVKYSLERLDEIHAIYHDADIIKYTTPNGKAKSKDQLIKGIEAYNAMHIDSNNSQGKWLLVEKASNKVIGYGGIFYIDDIQKTELSYALLKDFRSKGFATEALEGFKQYVFNTLNLTKICSLIRFENTASEKVALRVGMVYSQDVNVWGFDFKLYTLKNPSQSSTL